MPVTDTNPRSAIADFHNTTNFDGLLKEVYLPALNDVTFNDAKFTALIGDMGSESIDYEGQRIVHTFKTQRAGGVGAIPEGGDFVKSIGMKGKQVTETIRYLNAYFEITGPAVKAVKEGKASFVSATADSLNDMMITAKNDFERQLVGTGNGSCGKVRSIVDFPTDANTKAIDVDGSAYFDTQFLRQGQRIKIYSADLDTERTSTDGVLVITSVTRGSKYSATRVYGTITLERLDGANFSSITTAVGDIIVNENSIEGTGSDAECIEVNGLQALVSDGAEASGAYKTIWGQDRTLASYWYLKSQLEDHNDATLNEASLLGWMMDLEFQNQANPNLLMCSPRAMLEYFNTTIGDSSTGYRQFNTNSAMSWTGGVVGMGIQLGHKNLMLTSLSSCPTGNVFMLDTNAFKFAKMTAGWDWLTPGGAIMNQKEASDNQFATAVNYCQFLCLDPFKQLKIHSVDEAVGS